MFKGVFAVFAVLASLSGFGTDYFLWKGGDADSVQDYTKYNVADSSGADSGTPASETLPSGSVVFLAKSSTFHAYDGDFAYLNTLAGFVPLTSSATVILENESDQHLDGYISNGTTSRSGSVYKKGKGTLALNFSDKTDGSHYYGYYMSWHVDGGVLELVPGIKSDSATRYYYRFNIAAGAEVKMPKGAGTTYLYSGLCGAGTISHETISGLIPTLQVCGSLKTPFSGKITGNMKLRAYGSMVLTGTETDFTGGAFEFYGCEIEAVDFLNSLGGIGKPFSVSSDDMCLRSLAEASMSCDREFRHWATSPANMELDGGAYGGLSYSGAIRLYTANVTNSQALILSGDHANACTFSPSRIDRNGTGNISCFTLVKRGTGTWSFTPTTTKMGRMIAVAGVLIEDGVAQVTYLKSKSSSTPYTSFGMMTNDWPNVFQGYAYKGATPADTSKAVDYQIRLGKADAPGQNGILEYIGTADVSCTDRGFAITGNGGFKNETAKSFSVSDVRSVPLPEGGEAPALNVLTLDTSSADATSRVNDITEQAGAIKVLKKGTGVWTLGGRQLFTGGAEVAAGTLVIENPTDGAVLPNGLASVEVAADATLRVDGDGPAVEVKGLVIDVSGAGVLEGVAFAKTGSVDLQNVDLTQRSTRIPAAFAGVPTRSNLANWTITVNGEAVPSNYTVTLTDSGFSLDKKGLAILVR